MFDLKRFRKGKNLTQKELAQKLGITHAFVSKIELKRERMPKAQIERLKELYPSDNIDEYFNAKPENKEVTTPDTVKARLLQYINFKGIGNSDFCRSLNVSTSFVTSMRVSIQPDKIKSIASKYPDLNTGWLLTGEGNMLKGEPAAETQPAETSTVAALLEVIQSQQRTIESLTDLLKSKPK